MHLRLESQDRIGNLLQILKMFQIEIGRVFTYHEIRLDTMMTKDWKAGIDCEDYGFILSCVQVLDVFI